MCKKYSWGARKGAKALDYGCGNSDVANTCNVLCYQGFKSGKRLNIEKMRRL
jgi:hypothetical protein